MSLYTDRKNFFKQLSANHYLVRYGQMDDGIVRKSFINIDNEEELAAAVINQAHFPMVVHVDFQGRPVDKSGSVRVQIINELMFLDKPIQDADMPTVDLANNAARNRSFDVMIDFISWMNEEYEENGSCGPFKDINLNTFKWRMQDYISDGLLGWVLEFTDEVSAAQLLAFDENKWDEVILNENGEAILAEDNNEIIEN